MKKKLNIIVEQEEVVRPVGDPYEYKKTEDGRYYTKKKSSSKWIDVTGTKFENPIREKVFRDLSNKPKQTIKVEPKIDKQQDTPKRKISPIDEPVKAEPKKTEPSITIEPEKPKSSIKSKQFPNLPDNINSSISKLEKKYGLDITDKHISREFEQEGNYREDAGGENKRARSQINKLVSDCKNKFPKISSLGVVSGYRSYDTQVDNFGRKAQSRGIDGTQRANTIPGFSQHHTGKAFDIFSVETSWWDKNSDVKEWVAKNANKYGFDVTYKTQGPLRIAEPWHLYYVGGEIIEHSIVINNIVMEEVERIKNLMK